MLGFNERRRSSKEKSSNIETWPQFQRDCLVFTFMTRGAIALILKNWNIRPEDEVLMPAYNCGVEVDTVLWSGAKVVFYRIDRKAAIDWKDVYRKITSKTRVLYITHFFGWQHSLKEITDFCRKRGIYILEDCALSLFSAGDEGPIGNIGDASVYNLPKTLGVPDGGALTGRKEMMKNLPVLKKPAKLETIRNSLPLLKGSIIRWLERKNFYEKYGFKLLKSRYHKEILQEKEFPDMPQSYYFDAQIADKKSSNFTMKLLKNCRPKEIISIRRRNYNLISEALRDIVEIEFLFPILPKRVCPLGFPVLVNHRDKLSIALNNLGISSIPWWQGFNQKMNWDEFPEAKFLKNHLLILPIHQQMKRKHINYTAQCVKTLMHYPV